MVKVNKLLKIKKAKKKILSPTCHKINIRKWHLYTLHYLSI